MVFASLRNGFAVRYIKTNGGTNALIEMKNRFQMETMIAETAQTNQTVQDRKLPRHKKTFPFIIFGLRCGIRCVGANRRESFSVYFVMISISIYQVIGINQLNIFLGVISQNKREKIMTFSFIKILKFSFPFIFHVQDLFFHHLRLIFSLFLSPFSFSFSMSKCVGGFYFLLLLLFSFLTYSYCCCFVLLVNL